MMYLGCCIAFSTIVGILALCIFVSAKILVWGGLKHLYLKAGVLGAIYGLITVLLFAYLRSIAMPVALFDYFMFAPASIQSQAHRLNEEGARLVFQLTLLENGPDFVIKGSIIVIAITYALRYSGIPWFKDLAKH